MENRGGVGEKPVGSEQITGGESQERPSVIPESSVVTDSREIPDSPLPHPTPEKASDSVSESAVPLEAGTQSVQPKVDTLDDIKNISLLELQDTIGDLSEDNAG